MPKKNLSMSGNPRYQPNNLVDWFGYDNLYLGFGMVQVANLKVLHDIKVISDEDFAELTEEKIKDLLAITTTEVDLIERKITKHDARAWVRKAQEILGPRLGRWLHIPLTSYDPLDTGRIWQYQQAYYKTIRPTIKQLILLWANLVEKHSNQIQVGRTHKQYALPITVGFWLATILNRVITNFLEMDRCASGLVGKISGAVGAYNAQVALGFEDLCGSVTYEERVLNYLNLNPATISTQILPPEPLAYFLHSATMLSASLGQLGRDGRNLMGSDIGEVSEEFEPGQVGSSTMAQKRNPINFENIEGTWLKNKIEFGKVFETIVSDLQRDLVASSIMRDFPTILINLQLQINTLLRKNDKDVPFISRISVDGKACQNNFAKGENVILAEPLYIALQMAGFEGDAHHFINHTLIDEAKKFNVPLVHVFKELALGNAKLMKVMKNIPEKVWNNLWHPEEYTGKAKKKAMEIVNLARSIAKSE